MSVMGFLTCMALVLPLGPGEGHSVQSCQQRCHNLPAAWNTLQPSTMYMARLHTESGAGNKYMNGQLQAADYKPTRLHTLGLAGAGLLVASSSDDSSTTPLPAAPCPLPALPLGPSRSDPAVDILRPSATSSSCE